MASFVTPANGDLVTAEVIAQLTEDFGGLRNIPVLLTGINDAAAYALTLKNAGAGSRGLIVYAADGTTVLLQVSGTGVLASRTGAAAERVLTTGESASLTPAMFAATAGTAWTPSLTQGGTTPTLTNNGSWYLQYGKLVLVTLNITATSAGGAGNAIIISSLPAGGPRFPGGFAAIGSFAYSRAAGAGIHVGSAIGATSTNLEFLSSQGTGGYMGQANGPSFAVASGDVLGATLMYEAA